MIPQPDPSDGHEAGTLKQPGKAEQREIMRRWHQIDGGKHGQADGNPSLPDDAVAYRLLEAAEAAIGRGDRQKAANILRLVVKDYRASQESAFARRVIDRLAEMPGDLAR